MSGQGTRVGKRLLIVDDDESLRRVVVAYLSREGYAVTDRDTAEGMFETLADNVYDVLLLDVFLGPADSLRYLCQLRREYPRMQIIMMTGSGSIDMAVEALRRGVYDFITKPVDAKRLITSVAAATQLARREPAVVQGAVAFDGESAAPEFLGETETILHLREVISRVAQSNCTALIVGETGTGKELVAQALHRQSARAGLTMPVLNCGALPNELVESELFGHEKGAFTGATQAKRGFAELANGSCLMLDEIGEMPLALQSKLLRFLQEKVFHRVGGTSEISVDVRVICATNQDPLELVEQGRMREDLYYRISQVTLRVPSLRERRDDVPRLAQAFLRRAAEDEGRTFDGFERAALQILTDYHWPGNVRHLLNVITELSVLHDGPTVTVDMLPSHIVQSVRDRQTRPATDSFGPETVGAAVQPLWQSEKNSMQRALQACDGNVGRAAGLLEVSAATFYRKIRKYDLRGACSAAE